MNRKLSRTATAVWVAGALLGCAEGGGGAQAEQMALATQADELAAELGGTLAEGTELIVRLAFGEEADLDLYVTDPLLDTVYFARHESRTGGRISADVRCDSSGSRIEEVRFDAPWAGRYRVGVDHPKRCDGASPPAPAAYAVTAQVDGKTYSASGSVAVEQFQLVVLEFELQEGSADAQLAETN
jgi:hypothetical protein